MPKVYVRWMAAFAGKKIDLFDALKFEYQREDNSVCEKLTYTHGKLKTNIGFRTWDRETRSRKIMIGIMVNDEAIFREFSYDCWSEKKKDGSLKATRTRHSAPFKQKGKWRWHSECWIDNKVPNSILGIVVPFGWYEIKWQQRKAITGFSSQFKIPVFSLKRDGTLERIIIDHANDD